MVEREGAEEVLLGVDEGAEAVDLIVEPAGEGVVVGVRAEVGEG
ncbi:hypothetical protein ACFCYF_30695 [Streptomyces chartreusis]